jgi:hypothetical protein
MLEPCPHNRYDRNHKGANTMTTDNPTASNLKPTASDSSQFPLK